MPEAIVENNVGTISQLQTFLRDFTTGLKKAEWGRGFIVDNPTIHQIDQSVPSFLEQPSNALFVRSMDEHHRIELEVPLRGGIDVENDVIKLKDGTISIIEFNKDNPEVGSQTYYDMVKGEAVMKKERSLNGYITTKTMSAPINNKWHIFYRLEHSRRGKISLVKPQSSYFVAWLPFDENADSVAIYTNEYPGQNLSRWDLKTGDSITINGRGIDSISPKDMSEWTRIRESIESQFIDYGRVS